MHHKGRNLKGLPFGYLTVLGLDYKKSNNKYKYWRCRCKCGTIKSFRTGALTWGHSKSCGVCWMKDRRKENNPNFLNLVGKRFSRLEVLEMWEYPKWLCVCDCGGISISSTNALRMEQVKSCGCLKRDRVIETHLIDLTGQRFGSYMILKRVEYKRGRNTHLWERLCDCGEISYHVGYELTTSKIQSCYSCFAKTQHGKNHPNWNPKLTKNERLLRRNGIYPGLAIWTRAVYKRDKYVCQITGRRGAICAHHLNGWSWCKKGRIDVDNGATILLSVHKWFHHLYGIKRRVTKENFEEFRKNLTRQEIDILVNLSKTYKKKLTLQTISDTMKANNLNVSKATK